jgi:hypothetical protein
MRTTKNVRIAATTSPLDSTPAEISPRLPVINPVASFSATSSAAAAIDTSVVRAGTAPTGSQPRRGSKGEREAGIIRRSLGPSGIHQLAGESRRGEGTGRSRRL